MPFEEPPEVQLSDALRAALAAKDRELPEAFARELRRQAHPCVRIYSERISAHPLQRGALMSLLGAKTSAPTLGLCESKFGGAPYCEDEDFGPFSYLGQVDLAQATQALPEARRLRGLLRIDVTNRTDFTHFTRAVWFPEPNEERAKRFHTESLATWETRLRFEAAWCLPEGRQLEHLWPLPIPSYELDALFLPPYAYDDDSHQLLGHRSSGLDEPYDFDPPAGMSKDIEDYAQLLRLTFDNAAGVHWGSNALYFLALEADLQRGDLSRVVCTAANY